MREKSAVPSDLDLALFRLKWDAARRNAIVTMITVIDYALLVPQLRDMMAEFYGYSVSEDLLIQDIEWLHKRGVAQLSRVAGTVLVSRRETPPRPATRKAAARHGRKRSTVASAHP